jgi:ribosomal protein S18 acetylase RimI-like enzyme
MARILLYDCTTRVFGGKNNLSDTSLTIREILPQEHESLGLLMVDAYSNLVGFPSPDEMPEYYEMLTNIGSLNTQPKTKVLVAISAQDTIVGGVVYFEDMSQYGAKGAAALEENASGIRLLGADPKESGRGIGRALTNMCIELAQEKAHSQVILHTTVVMKVAWALYEKLGFDRTPSLDFEQYGTQILGFSLRIG